MAQTSSYTLHFFVLNLLTLFTTNPTFCANVTDEFDEFSIIGYDLDAFHGDYTPPSPPPPSPPPHPPSLTCEDDLYGIGSLNTTCVLNSSLIFIGDVYIEGNGNLHILSGVNLSCSVLGCSITVNLSGEFRLGGDAKVVAGSVTVNALNASLLEGSLINVSAMAGAPPTQTSGTPSGVHGSGGGHGGRGASCVSDNTKLPDDVWGGDAYSWSSLDAPMSYGSKGGTTAKEENYGGEGGGRIWIEVNATIEVNGKLFADGGDVGVKGGGGSGGSIFVKAQRM